MALLIPYVQCLVLTGRGQDDDGDGKNRRAKAGRDRGGDDTENAKKLVEDLMDAFNGFGVSQPPCLQVGLSPRRFFLICECTLVRRHAFSSRCALHSSAMLLFGCWTAVCKC